VRAVRLCHRRIDQNWEGYAKIEIEQAAYFQARLHWLALFEIKIFCLDLEWLGDHTQRRRERLHIESIRLPLRSSKFALFSVGGFS
jgi:hypothetical protein